MSFNIITVKTTTMKEDTHMADLPPYPDESGDTGVGLGRSSTSGIPRWVRVFGIIALVLVLLFVISLLAGVRHGPGLHTPSGDAGGHTPSSSVTYHRPPGGLGDHTPPEDAPR
jgi:hypothetical protein